jgi:hypothetical protein
LLRRLLVATTHYQLRSSPKHTSNHLHGAASVRLAVQSIRRKEGIKRHVIAQYLPALCGMLSAPVADLARKVHFGCGAAGVLPGAEGRRGDGEHCPSSPTRRPWNCSPLS